MSETCRKCTKGLGRADRFCGACGEPTAQLAWKGTDRDDWSHGSGKIALTGARGTVTIALRNEGVLPLAVGVGLDTLQSPPPWLDEDGLRNARATLVIEPGEERALEIPLKPKLIEAALQPAGVREGPRVALTHPIRLVTTAALPRGTATSLPPSVEVLIAIARVPWLNPPGTHYPYLAAEHLADTGLVCELELVNDSADEIVLTDLKLADADALSGLGSLEATALVRELPAIKGANLAAGQRLKIPLILQDPGAHQSGEPRWFNFEVVVGLRSPNHDEDRSVLAVVQGFVGLGPRLVLESARTLTCSRGFSEWTEQIDLHNPAPIPVRIESITTLDEAGRMRPGPDWLVIEEQTTPVGSSVAGHSTHTLQLRIDPSRRPRDEWTREVCTRRVRITHDGHPAGEVIEVEVQARLGEVVLPRNVVLGVDFGTSNSTVWLVSEDGQGEGLAVEPPSALVEKRDRMASAMFYRGSKGDRAFDYGAKALRQCEIEPRNLVRGVKTLINQQKRQEHYFVGATGGYVRMHATELLSEFIGELNRRANRTINELAARRREDFGFPTDGAIVVPTAVFTHPVGPSPAMIEALHRAAARQGLIEPGMAVEEFRLSRCVDEATAAIVAYVWLRAIDKLHRPIDTGDLERILCVDIGGGTMDVAAAEVHNFRQFQTTDGAKVTIRLRANEGDSRFGGDHLDKLIAREALRALAEHASRAKVELPFEVMVPAIDYSESFSGFRDWYDHNQHLWPNLTHDELLRVFARVGDLRRAVEEQKKGFDGKRDFRFPFNPADLQGRGNPATLREQIDVVLSGADLAAVMHTELEERLGIIDKVCHRAGWRMADVDTILLTGQTNYYRGYCDAIETYVLSKRGPDAPPLHVITPLTQDLLCPKGCVALGAAVWGVSQIAIEGWLTIDCEVSKQLTFDLKMRRGPNQFRLIEGLGRGASFPAVGVIELPPGKPITALTLYRDDRPFADITIPEAAVSLRVEVRGPRDIWVYAGNDPAPRQAICKDIG